VYDTVGNVYEWVKDCWHINYKDAPSDGSAWLSASGGDCKGASFGGRGLVLQSYAPPFRKPGVERCHVSGRQPRVPNCQDAFAIAKVLPPVSLLLYL